METKTVKVPMSATRIVRLAKISEKIKGDAIVYLLTKGLNNLNSSKV